MNPEQKAKVNLRKRDRKWFKKNIPLEMMSLLQIHHSWDAGRFCFLVTPEQHILIEQGK